MEYTPICDTCSVPVTGTSKASNHRKGSDFDEENARFDQNLNKDTGDGTTRFDQNVNEDTGNEKGQFDHNFNEDTGKQNGQFDYNSNADNGNENIRIDHNFNEDTSEEITQFVHKFNEAIRPISIIKLSYTKVPDIRPPFQTELFFTDVSFDGTDDNDPEWLVQMINDFKIRDIIP